MLTKLALAFIVMAACVVVHASVINWLMRRLRSAAESRRDFWRVTWVCVRLAAWIIAGHLVEIAFWAVLFGFDPEISNLETAFYFSAVTYTTTGYGDIVSSPEWRMVAGVEALTGILMCGWSAAFFFAVLTRLYGGERTR
ncbi:MAG TPA: potassium channel family protein [Vicinamibacterales bacterium]|nr:potassium channel family protein [Vicinamibacterales bacterium]